jgi:glycosyltransferase involved in cell wall biosynthesis
VELVGDGPLRAEITNALAENGLGDTVTLVGHISHSELIGRFASGQVALVVLPSVSLADDVREGIPISLVEAMSHGIPVVATATGGIPELLEGAGILVPERDVRALAGAILQLLGDRDLRERVGEAGRRRVEESFDVMTQTRRLIAEMRLAS